MKFSSIEFTDVVNVALRDRKSIHIRPVQEADRMAIRAFFEHVSSESLWFRFLGLPNLDWVANWSVDVDYADRYALVATTGAERSIVAHGANARIRVVPAPDRRPLGALRT